MNILYYLFGKLTSFISLHHKKISIFIPFLLGIFFSLFYILHIHNYHFVFPHSALLYVLSSISFLTSILIVLKYIDSKIFKRIIMGMLFICLLIFIGYVLSELKILEHKILRFRLIKILTLILFVTNALVILFENKVIPDSYKYIMANKLEVLMYCVCLLPFIAYVCILYPGSSNWYDTSDIFVESGGLWAINSWQSVIIAFIFRVSLAFHLPALSLLYIINILGIVHSAITISRIVKKVIWKYLLLICTYLFPILTHHFWLQPKDFLSTFFIMFAVSMLIYSMFKKINYNFYLGIFFLIIVSLDRHNQITQTIVLIIPFCILYTCHKSIPIKSSLKIIMLFLLIVFSLQKLIFSNKLIIRSSHPESWIYSSDILYIMFDQKKTCEEYKSIFHNRNCKDYNKDLITFDKLKTSPKKLENFIFKRQDDSIHDTKLWFKYITNYFGSWLTFHYTVTLQNFLNNHNYNNYIHYKSNVDTHGQVQIRLLKDKYNYSLGYVHFKKYGYIDKIQKLSIPPTFKYKLYLVILVLIITFIINKFKVFPIIMDEYLKYTCISYYLSLSCITLFVPLVLLVPTGWEARYLAGIDFPLIISIVMLLIYLYKKLVEFNKKINTVNHSSK